MGNPTACFKVILLAGLLLVGWRGTGHSQSIEEIFRWTAQQMKVSGDLLVPPIFIVSHAEIKQVFLGNNRNAYLRWESDYGPARAREILKGFLSEIVGLFEPSTNVIYVGDFLSPCRREAILAHEMTHYFQHKYRGSIEENGTDPQIQKWQREMEAYGNEEKYGLAFCR